MKSFFKKMVAGVSAIAMISTFSMGFVSADEETTTYTAEILLNDYNRPLMEDGIHGDTNLEDMEYIHYEMSDIQDAIDSMNNLANAEYNDTNMEIFSDLEEQFNDFAVRLTTSYQLSSLYYNQEPTPENLAEYSHSENLYVEFINEYQNALKNVMSGSFGTAFLDELQLGASSGSIFAQIYEMLYEYYSSFLNSDTINEEVQAINLEITEKLSQYLQLIQVDISNVEVEYDGKTITYNELLQKYIYTYLELCEYSNYSSIPQDALDEYYTIEQTIDDTKKAYGIDNETLGQLYIDLVKLYNDYAIASGYSSYIDMNYPYELNEINQISNDVKAYITPVLEKYSNRLERCPMFLDAVNQTYTIDEINLLTTSVISAVGEEYLDIYNYMTDHNLLVLDEDYVFSQGYTAVLQEYSQSYIYLTFNNADFYDCFTNGITHEFGHFIDWYENVDGFGYSSMASAENVSVSFSYICNDNLDAYFNDEDVSNILCVNSAINNTLNYVNYCLSSSELEVYAFQNFDVITPSELQEKYLELNKEYGLLSDISYEIGGLKEYNSYTLTNQLYVQPFYTIDYSMAGLTALNVLNSYANDTTAGIELFDSLYTNDYYYYDYVTMMSEGLGIDVYADDYVQNIANNLDAYLSSKMSNLEQYQLGDVNLDGNLNTSDLLILKKYLLGFETTEFNSITADINEDDNINVIDLLKLKRILLGLE